jgi:glycosyltransferase involved in cell wall biosynthesis
MKVLHLVDSLNIGGSECLAVNLADGFRSQGVDSIVCALGDSGNLVSRLQNENIPYTNIGAIAGVRPSAMLKIGGVLRNQRCDYLITHHFRQLFHAAPAAFVLRRPIIHVEHDFHSYIERSDIIKKMGYCMPAVKAFVGVSEEITNWFQANMKVGLGRFQTISNGVDTNRFKPDEIVRKHIRMSLKIPDDAIVIGTCARMEPVKGLEILILAFERLLGRLSRNNKANTTCIQLVLVGDGTQRRDLERLAESLGIDKKCHFTGAIDNVNELLKSFDIYSMTSKDEGLPLSIMEAMSTALPIVAFNVGSVSNIVNDKVGILLPDRGIGCLSDALYELVVDSYQRVLKGTVARESMLSSFSFDRTINSYIDCF